jgi:hypothetical protein
LVEHLRLLALHIERTSARQGGARRFAWKAGLAEAERLLRPSEAWHPRLDHLYPGNTSALEYDCFG